MAVSPLYFVLFGSPGGFGELGASFETVLRSTNPRPAPAPTAQRVKAATIASQTRREGEGRAGPTLCSGSSSSIIVTARHSLKRFHPVVDLLKEGGALG